MGLFSRNKIPGTAAIVKICFPGETLGEWVDKKQVIAAASVVVNDHARRIADCVKLVNETLEPRVFFERYEALFSLSEDLANMEEYYPFKPPMPSEQHRQLLAQRIDTINRFIDRYFDSMITKLLTLKTEAAKRKRIEDFYNTLTYYSDKMEPENIARFSEMYERFN